MSSAAAGAAAPAADEKKPQSPQGSGKPQDDTAATTAAAGTSSSTAAAPAAEPEFVEEEEVVEGDWIRPQVEVHEVEVRTGEEDEEVFWSHRAKLYRWAKATQEWKERGLGDAKLLKHKETKKIRFLLRQEKTHKIVANHYVFKKEKFCELTPNSGSDKIWVWTVPDFAEDEVVVEQFGLRFGKVEDATEFKEKFEEACKLNEPLFAAAAAAADEAEKAKESSS